MIVLHNKVNLMKITLSVLTIITLLSVGCSSSESIKNKSSEDRKSEYSKVLPKKDLIIVDLDTMKKTIGKYSSFFTSVKYVPLETTKESLVGSIDHLEIFDDTLFVLDMLSAKAIFLFDLSGKFIRKIGKTGRGPEEWIRPVSISLNKEERELLVLDGQLQKIFRYSLSGKFLGKISLHGNEIRSSTIECLNNKVFLDARKVSRDKSSPGFLLQEIDNQGNTINKWFDARINNKGWDQGQNPWYFSGSGSLYSTQSGIKYADLFMDTIYSINPDGIQPFIALKTKDRLTAEKIAEIYKENPSLISFLRAPQHDNGLFGIRSYAENDDLIFFIFNQGREMRQLIINKKPMKPFFLKGIMNDIIFRGNDVTRTPQYYSGEKNIIVGKVNNLKDFQECIKKRETNLNEEEKTRLLSIQPTDNPLLIILQTKLE